MLYTCIKLTSYRVLVTFYNGQYGFLKKLVAVSLAIKRVEVRNKISFLK